MFTLVRIHVPSVVLDADGSIARHVNPDYVWDYVIKNHKTWHSKEIKLLYMTQRHMQEDTSLIIDAECLDALVDFLVKHIAPLKYVRGFWILNMAKMRFFQIPAERSGEFSRYTVTLDVLPEYMNSVYEEISMLKPGRDIMVNYIAHTFQSFTASTMVSVLAVSRNHMEKWVEDCIKSLDGIMEAEITHISKTKRLVSHEEWLESVGAYLVAPGGKNIVDIDPMYDDSMIAGC